MSFDDFTFINLEHLTIQSIYSKYLFHIDLPNLTTLLFGQYFAKEMITDFTISHFNQLKSLFIGPGALQKVTKFTISNNPILETIIFNRKKSKNLNKVIKCIEPKESKCYKNKEQKD